MKKMASPVDMEDLPCDVLSNIFIRLLAKQLVQMRCVSKSWNALLSESNFIKSHLHRSIHNNNEGILLFFQQLVSFDSSHGPLTTRISHSPHLELTKFMKLKLPVDPQHKDAFGYVVGSMNGLICFSYVSGHDRVIRIWNPSLSLCSTLPSSSFSYNAFQLRFGFDPRTDDYKVVKVAFFIGERNMETQPQGEVYSMRKGSWELISHRIPSHIKCFIQQNESCVVGYIHWLCATNLARKPRTIVAFDLGAKTYSEIPLPDPVTDSLIDLRVRRTIDLGVLGGKLCVMTCIIDGGCKCDVWVMDDDESWVKQHVFSPFNGFIIPYGFMSRNEFLFKVDFGGRFALYDLIAANTKFFEIKWTHQFQNYAIFEYVDSLVWIAPDSKLNWPLDA